MTDDERFLADLHAIATRARASNPDASVVPNSWQQVLASMDTTTETTTERRPSMNMQIAQPTRPIWEQSMPHLEQSRSFGDSIRRFTNLAATVALVLAVAVGGWLAMSQMPGGDGEGRLAFLGQSDGGTCDVEPLSVDRVMEIVKNPYPFMENGSAGEPVFPDNPDDLMNRELMEAGELGIRQSLREPGEVPSDEDFESASAFANSYLQCLQNGTRGQVWHFYSPLHIQLDVLREFPVFADEDAVRARVEERVILPAYEYDNYLTGYDNGWNDVLGRFEPEGISTNDDPALSLSHDLSGYPFGDSVTLGVKFVDANEETVYLTTATGNVLIPNSEGIDYGATVTVGWSQFYEPLYIIPESPVS